MNMYPRHSESDQAFEAANDQQLETPADRAARDGDEPISIERWTDAELKQRARDLNLPGHESLSRAQLIESLRDKP